MWKHEVLAQLEIRGLDSVLQPEELDPKGKGVAYDDSDSKTKLDPKRLDKDRRVRNLLSMSSSDMVLRKVIKAKSALKMWTALELHIRLSLSQIDSILSRGSITIRWMMTRTWIRI